MANSSSCGLCGSSERRVLPNPHPKQSMLSDGRIFPDPLDKSLCLACGAIAHTRTKSAAEIQALYDSTYDLGAAPGEADLQRNTAYADFMGDFLADGVSRHVLEVGCGSGQTLAALVARFPHNTFAGIEAAEQLAARGNEALRISQSFVEDLPPPATPYDFIYSINVIEHAADPRAFLAAIAGQLAPGGQCVIICPASHPANLELLFLDHVTTFTAPALAKIAAATGFAVVQAMPALAKFAGFQAVILSHGDSRSANSAPLTAPSMDAEGYLSAWATLEQQLLDRVEGQKTVHLFGAGEMAALLRCYAPRLWERVGCLVVDDVAGARQLGKPVVSLDALTADSAQLGAAVVIASQPRSQPFIAQKLVGKGLIPICFDDIITG